MRCLFLFEVAPMMGHSHGRFWQFWRLMSESSTLYSEMIPAGQLAAAFARGQELDELQGPTDNVVLQLGGADPRQLHEASRAGVALGFREINLNCGCPSSAVAPARAQGAALMLAPERVATACSAMAEAGARVTVKHRLGACRMDEYDASFDADRAFHDASSFVDRVSRAGVTKFIVHARIALLDHFSDDKTRASRSHTIANRQIPPLRVDVVRRLKLAFPQLQIVCNGGLGSIDDVQSVLDWADGAMVGRALINHPCAFADVDAALYGRSGAPARTRGQVLDAYIDYVQRVEQRDHPHPDHRKRLLAPPYHLFAGEPDCGAYMRRIRNLANSRQHISAASVLRAARAEVNPSALYDTPLSSAVGLTSLPVYDQEMARSGPLRRLVH